MSSPVKHIKLRGHHLICLHFFMGEGYAPEFVDNLRAILARAKAGEEVWVVDGPDDVCRMCPYLKGRKCDYGKGADAGIREMDITALTLLGLKNRDKVNWSDIGKEIPAIFRVWSEKYCKDCDWREACEKDPHYKLLSVKKKLRINFDEVQKAMEDISRDSFDYYLNLKTGEVMTFSEEILNEIRSRLYPDDSDEIEDNIEYMELDWEPELPGWMEDEIELVLDILLDENGQYVRIPERKSSLAFTSMAAFAGTVEDPALAEELLHCLDGKGAFRKFKDTLMNRPRERKKWHGYNAKAMREEITEWLSELGIEPVSGGLAHHNDRIVD
jgi:uncharacterized protein